MARKLAEPPFVVGDSPIHGRGLFATRRLRAGSIIGEFQGPRTRRDGPHVLWLSDNEGLRVDNELRYVNHSSRPNAEARGTTLVAIRNTQPGAEITIHYGADWD